jgi:6-phosphofructokinase 1
VAVSEGVQDESGVPVVSKMAKTIERDAHGNVQLAGSGALADFLCGQVSEQLGLKRVRGDTLGYLQRSFVGCVSDVDSHEAREVGEKAVQFALRGDCDGSVVIERIGNYAIDYKLVPLAAVAGKTRIMPDRFISDDAVGVTTAFDDYLRPLIGASLPRIGRLRPNLVTKILKSK